MNFCEKCGKELQPGEVCSCQQPQTDAAASAPQQAAPQQTAPQVNEAPKAEGQNNNKLIIGVVAAIAALVVIVLIAVLAGGGSYKTPINKLQKLINSQNKDPFAYQELMTDPLSFKFSKDVFSVLKKSDDVKEGLDDAKESIGDFYEDLKGFKITKIEISSADKMSNKELREYNERFDSDDYDDAIDDIKDMDKGDLEDAADMLDISVSDVKKIMNSATSYFKSMKKAKVTEGYEVTLRIYGTFEKDKDKTEKIKDIKVLKMNGKWFIADGYKLFKGMEFQEDLDDIDMMTLYRCFGSLDFSSLFF